MPLFAFGRDRLAFTFFFRDSQTLELAIEEALPGLQGLARSSTSGMRDAPWLRTLHAGHPVAGADVELRVQQRSHPCNLHRPELCWPNNKVFCANRNLNP